MRKTTKEQINDPEYLRDARNDAAKYRKEMNLQPSEMLDHFTDVYRDLNEPITRYCKAHDREIEIWLTMSVFEVPGIEDWLDRFCTPVPDNVRPHVTDATRERAINLTSILRAADPKGTEHWGRRDEDHAE